MLQNKELLIVGAGPVGLSAGLFLHDCAKIRVIEKLKEPSQFSKAFGVSPRTLHLLESTGATELFLKNGRKLLAINLYKNEKFLVKNDLSRVKHKYPFMLIQSQADSEAIMTELLSKKGIIVERGAVLTYLSMQNEKVNTDVIKNNSQRSTIISDLVLAADGANSTVRKQLSIDFKGSAFNDNWILYDLELETPLTQDEAHGIMLDKGALFMVRIKGNVWRIISNIPDILNQLPFKTAFGSIQWKSEFRISHRMVETFQRGKVFFAGDAAHIHSGLGARGMNLGIEDAYVFSKLLKSNSLSEYNGLREPIVKYTIDQVEFLTDIMRGKTAKSKTFKAFAPLLMPMIFPFVKDKVVKFVLGVDHAV